LGQKGYALLTGNKEISELPSLCRKNNTKAQKVSSLGQGCKYFIYREKNQSHNTSTTYLNQEKSHDIRYLVIALTCGRDTQLVSHLLFFL